MNRFVGRDTDIKRLEEFFQPGSLNRTRCRVYVIHGLGGIRKTQLAIEYARRYRENYSAVLWLDGSSKDSLNQSLADVARRLPQNELSADTVVELRRSKADAPVIIQGVLQWLSISSNRNWLLIFDNIDRDHLLKEADPQAYDVKDFFPIADHGSVVITSRLSNLQRYGIGLKLDIINDDQAMVILENNAQRQIKGRIIYMLWNPCSGYF